MSKAEVLRVAVNERLVAAAEEIFGLFERTIAEYEEELFRSKQKNERQRKLLDAVLKPQVRLHRAVFSADSQQDPDPPHTEEEQGRLWRSRKGKQLQGPAPEKSKDDDDESSQLHQRPIGVNKKAKPHASSSAQPMEIESDAEACRGDPDSSLQPANDDETPDCSNQADTVKLKGTQKGVSVSSEPEAANSDDDWKESRKPRSYLKTRRNKGVPEVGKGRNTSKKSFSCCQCGKTFKSKDRKSRPGQKPFVCSACVQRSKQLARVVTDRTRSGVKSFRCSDCKKEFSYKGDAVRHIRIHNGEKPFSCSVCGKGFTQSTGLRSHVRIHTGEKPYGCSLCPKRFNRSGILSRHMRVHTGEKPYSCSLCNARFTLSRSLLIHMRIHTGEKPFSCSVCDKKFTQKVHLTQHMTLHTQDTPFSCRACGRTFTRQSRVKNHKCVTKSSSS